MVLGSGRRIQDDKHVDSIQQFLEPLQNISPLESSQFPKAKSQEPARSARPCALTSFPARRL